MKIGRIGGWHTGTSVFPFIEQEEQPGIHGYLAIFDNSPDRIVFNLHVQELSLESAERYTAAILKAIEIAKQVKR